MALLGKIDHGVLAYWSNGKNNRFGLRVTRCAFNFSTRNSKHATRNRHLSRALLDLNSSTPLLQHSSKLSLKIPLLRSPAPGPLCKDFYSFIMCRSISSARSMASIWPSKPATFMASSIFTMQNGQAVTITSAPASRAISTRNTPMRCSSSGS